MSRIYARQVVKLRPSARKAFERRWLTSFRTPARVRTRPEALPMSETEARLSAKVRQALKKEVQWADSVDGRRKMDAHLKKR